MIEYYDKADLKSKFVEWYFNEFSAHYLFQGMNNMSEGNSPWHRENTIGIHTNMVVAQYLANSPKAWNSSVLLGAFACAFHDVGKPRASKKNGIKFKPERGEYLSFGGHEQISARMTEDWFSKNWDDMAVRFDLKAQDIYSVVWMIEYHLPWGIKKQNKLDAIAQTAKNMNIVIPFVSFLMADSYGRLSDDGPDKRAKTTDWCEEFIKNTEKVPAVPVMEKDQPILFMPIATSGAGKSTFIKKNKFDDHVVHSMDNLRLQWYAPDDGKMHKLDDLYRVAFEESCKDKQFESKVKDSFRELVKTGQTIFVDNTNASKKRRAFYIDESRRAGYFIIGILLPISLDEAMSRQESRHDKSVPEDAVVRIYNSMQMPHIGAEVDSLIVTDDNIVSA